MTSINFKLSLTLLGLLIGSEAAFADGLTALVTANQKQHDLIGLSASCIIGKEVISAASGALHPDNDAQFEVNNSTFVGSVTKSFTAAAVLLMIEDGLLHLNDTLDLWYPDYPNAADISILQLLNMTAGTFDYFHASPENPMIERIMADVRRYWHPDELIAFAGSQMAPEAPGTDYHYSNTNYILLGRVLEKVSGQTLERIFDERLISPLGMNTSSLSQYGQIPDHSAPGYLRNSGFLFASAKPTSVLPDDMGGFASLGWAAGGLIASSPDIAIWTKALFEGQIVSPEMVSVMMTPANTISDGEVGYGLGIEILETPRGTVYGHAGSIPGYAAQILYVPETGTAVSIISNDEGAEPLLLQMALEIAGSCKL